MNSPRIRRISGRTKGRHLKFFPYPSRLQGQSAPAVLNFSIVRRLVAEAASTLLRHRAQSVQWRVTPVPLGTRELRGCRPGRLFRQSGHGSSPVGKAPIVLSSPDLANTGHRRPVRNRYTHPRRNIRRRRIRSQGTTNQENRTQRNQNR